MAVAQQSLGAFIAGVSDARKRGQCTVGELGRAEPLAALPPLAFPAVITVSRVASRSALVAFDGNRYSVPPGYAGRKLVLKTRVGEPSIGVFTSSGLKIATHRLAPRGAAQSVRTNEHAALLEHAVLEAFTTKTSCARKTNRPPGEGSLAEIARLHGRGQPEPLPRTLADYAALAQVAC